MRNKMRGCGCGLLFFILFGFGCFVPVMFIIIITVVTWSDNHETAWLSKNAEVHQAIIVRKEITTQRRSVAPVLVYDVPERNLKEKSEVVNDDVYRQTQIGDRVNVWVTDSKVRLVRSQYAVNPRFYFLLLLPCLSVFAIIVLYRREHARWKARQSSEAQGE